MKDEGSSLAATFPILVLLVAAVPATASAFCFSFGSSSGNSARYSPYPPPWPGRVAQAYPGYGYSQPGPANHYGSIYYPQQSPYATVPAEFLRK